MERRRSKQERLKEESAGCLPGGQRGTALWGQAQAGATPGGRLVWGQFSSMRWSNENEHNCFWIWRSACLGVKWVRGSSVWAQFILFNFCHVVSIYVLWVWVDPRPDTLRFQPHHLLGCSNAEQVSNLSVLLLPHLVKKRNSIYNKLIYVNCLQSRYTIIP